jgi:hypothetical protein
MGKEEMAKIAYVGAYVGAIDRPTRAVEFDLYADVKRRCGGGKSDSYAEVLHSFDRCNR